MKLFKLAFTAITLLVVGLTQAQTAKIGNLTIDGAYTRATVPGQKVAGGFMKISSIGNADQLIGGTSPIADEVQLHTMSMDGNVMKMRQVNAIEVPSNSSVELKPGGLHLMFIGIKSPLVAGATVPVNLKFAKAGEVEIRLPVNAMMTEATSAHGASKH